MKKISIIIALILLVSIFNVGVSTQAAYPQPSFVLNIYSECGKSMLTWEEVLYESYDIYRQNNLIKTVDSTQVFIDENVIEGDHHYKIVANLPDNEKIKSITAKTNVRCFGQNECNTEMKFILDNKFYWVNNTKKGPMPMAPLLAQGRTFLVIRYITDELGANISWDAALRKVIIVTFRGKVIELFIGKNTAIVNGIEILIDPEDETVVPVIQSGRTLLPLRFVSDQMGASEIIWDDAEKAITLRFDNESICIKQKVLLNVTETNTDKIFAVDDYGNRYEINSKSTESTNNSRILLDGTLLSISDNGAAIFDLISMEPINYEYVFKGRVENCEITDNRGVLSLDNCLEVKNYFFTPGLFGLENISKNTFIRIETNSDYYINSWSYVTNETHCGLESQSINQNELIQSNKLWTIEGLNESEAPEILYCTENFDLDKLDLNNNCFNITYERNWLGRNICTGVDKTECDCNISVTPITPVSATIYKDVKYEFKFIIKNHEKSEKEITLDVDPGNITGRIKINPTRVTMKPGEEIEAILSVNIEEKYSGSKKIDYYVFCEGISIINSLDLSVISGSPRYKIEVPEDIVLNNNTRYVKIPFYITNDSFGSIFVRAVFNSSTSITDHEISPDFATIKPQETFKFIASGEMKFGRVMGQKIELYISTRINRETDTAIIPIYVDHSGRPKVDIWCNTNDDGTVTLNGAIDWDTFTRDSIIVHWGNNETETIESFPVTHKFENSGIYPISVVAKTKDAEVFSSALGFGYCMANINEESENFFESIELEINENNPTQCKFSGQLSKNKSASRIRSIQINWGDGIITGCRPELSGKFEKEYNYQQHIRYKGDKEYLVYVTFLESFEDESDTKMVHVEKRKITIKGSEN
ncbi:MAG: copper amine oxidase N-terminal domain-containing protein [Caldisericia bacterium]